MEDQTLTDTVWLEWLAEVMTQRPANSVYLNSERGVQVTRLCLDFERQDFNWHRADTQTFWLDIQLFVKYKLSDEDILFTLKQQPGVDNYSKHSAERNAYAEMMRGLDKLRKLNFQAKMQALHDTEPHHR